MKIFRNRNIKGAISIFLIIITIPTMLLSAVLIDGSRIISAKAMTQEATDLAASSVLSDYNQALKDEFGLFALNENDANKLKSIYLESLNATLLAHGMSADDEYSERLWDIMKTTLTGQKSYMGESFLNLYDFQVDSCTVEPLYSLANQSVLENQMVEYSKFRGLYVMANRMDIFSGLGNLKSEAEKNEVTTEVMEDKMGVDEGNAAADQELVKLRAEIDTLNSRVATVKTALDNYITSLRARMKKIYIENTDAGEDDEDDEDRELTSAERQASNAYESNRSTLKEAAGLACKQAKVVQNQANQAKAEVEKAIRNLEEFQSRNQGKTADNESVTHLLQDAKNTIEDYKTHYLPGIQRLIDDSTLNQMAGDSAIESNLNQVMEDIHEGITKYISEIEEMREEQDEEDDEDDELEITEYYYYYLNSSTQKTTSIQSAITSGGRTRAYQPALQQYLSYFTGKSWDRDQVDPSRRYANTFSNEIDESFAENQSGKTGNQDPNLEGEAAKGTIDEAVYQARPSKTFSSDTGKSNDTNFYNKNNNLTASKNILNQGKHSMILDIGETMRDDVLCLTYMFGTFKTRLTGVKKFSSEGMSSSDKNCFYMPEWRYAHPNGEVDMRLDPKKDRNTVLRSEIEYLVYGNRSDTANETAVYATIFAERMANNMVVMYAKDSINKACHAAAAAAYAASLGTVPEPVFFWIFLTAWVTAETIIEMDYLISGGYKIPLIKNENNILLTTSPKTTGGNLIDHYGKSGIFVSYEDYLLILLLIKGREKRIMRSADLIEMNMKKAGKADFTMAKSYTYLRADTNLSIRYLFGNVMPFGASYEKKGYTGRLHYKNTIYQGY